MTNWCANNTVRDIRKWAMKNVSYQYLYYKWYVEETFAIPLWKGLRGSFEYDMYETISMQMSCDSSCCQNCLKYSIQTEVNFGKTQWTYNMLLTEFITDKADTNLIKF